MYAAVHGARIVVDAQDDLAADFEPTPAWIAATLGISLEDADWLFILYVAQRADTSAWRNCRQRYYCEGV